jgi:hypothetical protein
VRRGHRRADLAALERELAAALAPATMPPSEAARIRAALRALPARPARRARWWLPCAAAVAAMGALAVWQGSGLRIEPAAADEAPSGFERMAVDLHERTAPRAAAVLVTASAAEARAWGRRRTGVDVSLAAVRPAEDDVALTGAEAVRYGDADALAVRYAVDGGPATLLAARSSDVPREAPEWTLAGKRVRARALRGHRVLTWANAGQSYVLVADLPAGGVRACFVCHTQAERRALIERLAP